MVYHQIQKNFTRGFMDNSVRRFGQIQSHFRPKFHGILILDSLKCSRMIYPRFYVYFAPPICSNSVTFSPQIPWTFSTGFAEVSKDDLPEVPCLFGAADLDIFDPKFLAIRTNFTHGSNYHQIRMYLFDPFYLKFHGHVCAFSFTKLLNQG